MQIETSREDDRVFTVEISGEDYSLAEIVHHELLDEKGVAFAGVVPPHPLIKKLVLKVRSQRVKPDRAFLQSVERSATNAHELLGAVNKALSGESE
jgi:DNA-directed RNA polymerase subunit L